MRRQLWQLDYFSEGSIPDALIGVPAGWTPDQIRQFQDYWDTEFAGDLARRRRANFVPGDTAARVVQTKEPEHKDDFDEWLARIICFAFRMIRKSGLPGFREDHAHFSNERRSLRTEAIAALYGRRNGPPR